MSGLDGAKALAALLKERENKPYSGPVVGTVLTPPPALTVQHPSGLVLDAADLVIAAHVLAGIRIVTLTHQEGAVRQLGNDTGIDLTDTDDNEAPWTSFQYSNLQCDFNDTLAAGDQVILIPTGDNQTFALIDKAVRL